MPLEPRQKELAAIGASIGANCRPCIEHHIAAGRAAGLSEVELDQAVVTAQAVREDAIELFSARVAELLRRRDAPPNQPVVGPTSTAHELVALGASVGANSHALLHAHVNAAADAGLSPVQIRSALKMAAYVQQHAAELTAEAATRAYAHLVATQAPAAATN